MNADEPVNAQTPPSLSRRDCLGALGTAAAVAGGALALSGAAGCADATRLAKRYCGPEPPQNAALGHASVALPPAGPTDPAVRLLNRAAFGPAPGDVVRVSAMGTAAYVDEQLAPPTSDAEPAFLQRRLRTAVGDLQDPSISALDFRDIPERDVLRQLSQAALLRAVYSRAQLRERMADFWTNHFNVYARKKMGAYLLAADEKSVVRAHTLGKFGDLVRASARSPAMLGYLDQEASRKGVPNENYARELLELHTLGVDGGYTQKDVQEIARCLTGWTIEDRFLHRRGTFRFDPDRHDDGPKLVLGHAIAPGGGERDGDAVLDIITRHPSTARHIARKLCRFFLGDTDEANRWTPKLAAVYAKTNGHIPSLLRPLLLSDDFVHGPPILKCPLDFVASALRALGADTDAGPALQTHLCAMGQPLHEWPLPDGYPDATHAWTGSLLARWNFAFALTSGGVKGTGVDLPALVQAANGDHADALVALILARRPGDEAGRSLHQSVAGHLARATGNVLAEAAALCLASPQFQWR